MRVCVCVRMVFGFRSVCGLERRFSPPPPPLLLYARAAHQSKVYFPRPAATLCGGRLVSERSAPCCIVIWCAGGRQTPAGLFLLEAGERFTSDRSDAAQPLALPLGCCFLLPCFFRLLFFCVLQEHKTQTRAQIMNEVQTAALGGGPVCASGARCTHVPGVLLCFDGHRVLMSPALGSIHVFQ